MSVKRWDKPRYQRMKHVQVVNGGEIVVDFEDGQKVSVAAEQLLPPGAYHPRWNELRFDAYEIIVPTSQGETEIPWSTVRLLSDKDFASHWARAAENQAKLVGLRLRELRKKRNLSSKEVAERAGITPQSLSRIENGRHDVVFTTLGKILAAMGCTLRDLADVQAEPASLKEIFRKLEKVGLKRDWMRTRIIPSELLKQHAKEGDTESLMNEVAKIIGRVFHWSVNTMLGTDPLKLDAEIVRTAKFKGLGPTQEIEAKAYVLYAHYLALLTLQATQHLHPSIPSKSPERLRRNVIKRYQRLDLEGLLRYVWDLGIPVLPLQDPGVFHGASWRISGRNIIVLKQVTPHQARWLFDLAHELGHVALHLSDDQPVIVETKELSLFEGDEEEQEASEFASSVLLYGRAEELAEKCVDAAKNSVEALKSAVKEVAAAYHVSVDVLANYMAYRLAMQGINWWGAASNLQIKEPLPAEIARSIFLEKVDLKRLSPEDRDLIMRALT